MAFRAGLVLAACGLALAAAAPASAKVPTVKLATASAGHVTVQLVSVDVKGKHLGKLPKRVRLGLRNARKLPPSIRVLWATRSYRIRHGRRYAGLAIVLNKAGATGSSAHARAAERLTFLEMLFEDREHYEPCPHCGDLVEDDELDAYRGICRSCEMMKADLEMSGEKDVDAATSHSIKSLEDMVGRDWKSLTGDPTPFDPTLDTGHYDDGHSFGWDKKPAEVEHAVLRDIELARESSIVPDVEVAGAFDLSGDGQVGLQNNTIVGPPVIS